MTTIYLIRHAEAEGNLYRRCQGWKNGLITTKGRLQIKALERRFEDIHIDAVYSSDLYRTMSTAGAIYRPKGLTLRVDSQLREIGGGCWEDLPWGQWLYEDRENLISFLRCQPEWSAPGSETYGQVRERMCQTIQQIAAVHPGQTVAVVSHGSAIRSAVSNWLGYALDKIGTLPLGDNTSVAKLLVENSRVQVEFYNDNSHLGNLAFTRNNTGWKEEAVAAMEAGSVRFMPMEFPQDGERYLSARQDGWAASHGNLEGFDGRPFLQVAQRNSAFAKDSVLAALTGSTFVGVLQMDWEQEAEEKVGRVPFLYIAPEYRSKGLGVQLLGQAVSVYRSMGRQVLRLRCAPENERAKRFYLSYGLSKVGEERGGVGHLDTMEKYIGLEL